MPYKKITDEKKQIASIIRHEMKRGKSQKQAVAIAMQEVQKHKRKRKRKR